MAAIRPVNPRDGERPQHFDAATCVLMQQPLDLSKTWMRSAITVRCGRAFSATSSRPFNLYPVCTLPIYPLGASYGSSRRRMRLFAHKQPTKENKRLKTMKKKSKQKRTKQKKKKKNEKKKKKKKKKKNKRKKKKKKKSEWAFVVSTIL